jgi:phage-related baseplate assembly protein
VINSTVIDLSTIPVPDAIETISFSDIKAAYIERFLAYWAAQRAIDPTLPMYDVEMLETDPANIQSEVFAFKSGNDRARVNSAVKAVLGPTARGADLDNFVARWNVQRLVITPATSSSAAVYESDAQLWNRYLHAVDRSSGGSASLYLYEAYTAFPTMQDAAVIGRAVHGRRGDVDVVISGPNGDAPTTSELAAVRAAVTSTDVKPEATSVTVIAAERVPYTVSLILEVPKGPDATLIVAAARSRVDAAIANRLKIGAEVPAEAISGAAYGPNVIKVRVLHPLVDIPANPYRIPVATGVLIVPEVQQ